MKILWIIACWMTVGHCGVVPWSQSKEDEAIHLFRSYCLNADKGVSGNIKWFCKKPTHYLPDQTFEHYKVITARPHNQKQVIFVQTPSRTYKHNVYVKGEADFNQDTHIYVVPGQDRHHVDIQGNIETKSGNGGKPHTFYLQKNPLDLADDKYPSHHHHHHHNDPYSPAYKPSYTPPDAPDTTYGSQTPAQPSHDHYPSYTHTAPRFELPPEDLDTSPKLELPQSQEVSTQIKYRRPEEDTPPRFDFRQPETDYRRPENDNSRFEFRRSQEETSRRFDYRRNQDEISPRYNNYRTPPQFDTQARFPNHIRPRRRHFEDDFITPHPDTVKKFSGFRNF